LAVEAPVPAATLLREKEMVFEPVPVGSKDGSEAGTVIGNFSDPVVLRLMS
jgi:hypothetical protein